MISFLTNVIVKRTSHNAAWWTDFLPDGGEGLWAVEGPAGLLEGWGWKKRVGVLLQGRTWRPGTRYKVPVAFLFPAPTL